MAFSSHKRQVSWYLFFVHNMRISEAVALLEESKGVRLQHGHVQNMLYQNIKFIIVPIPQYQVIFKWNGIIIANQ